MGNLEGNRESTSVIENIKNILEKIYPGYEIERIGGSKEEKHGTDVLVTISGLSNLEKYNIAIQVKNYKGEISDDNINNIIEQINKAKRYKWENDGKLIDQILVITSAKEEENPKLIEECKNKEIRVIFSEELEKLILRSIIESIDLKEIFDEMLQE